ncbi:MAG: right-handed parallel beta-helix repeat-containing protein, partial [Spirochaetes bacterium]|nr:right-handed parallel beta-helix repeat-containing protein [Spirochaetota bacterium]
MKRIVLSVLISLIVSSSLVAQSGPFFVDDDIGNDGNSGTFSQPFKTIQKAVNAMATNVSVASCYIYPGIYTESVEVFSNKNSGFMVITALTDSKPPVMTGSLSSNYGFSLTNADRIIIENISVKRYSYGIQIRGTARSNYFIRNAIFSNDLAGFYFNSDDADYNYVLTNHIYGLNQNICILVTDSDYNTFGSNFIHNASSSGIEMSSSATFNYAINNLIYSNHSYNVYLNGTGANNNTIISNHILKEGNGIPNIGIYVLHADNNLIKDNQVHQMDTVGIYLHGSATNNSVIGNTVYSNSDEGIYVEDLTVNDPVNNYVSSNTVWGEDQNCGIRIGEGEGTRLFRNLVFRNLDYNIHIENSSPNVEIINNTIFGSLQNHGVLWEGSSSGVMYNNIILSNGNNAADYGIQRSTSGIVIAAYNNIYGNAGGSTSGGVTMGSGNIFADPLLETTTSFTITTRYSPVVDNGTNIPAVTTNYLGTGPDMGYKESPFTGTNTGPFYIDDTIGNDTNPGTFTQPLRTIQKAVNIMSKGSPLCSTAITYIYPGIYSETVEIASNKNSGFMVIKALTNSNPPFIHGNLAASNQAFEINNADRVIIERMTIVQFDYGITLMGTARSNYLIRNAIYSNGQYGIELNSDDADYNYFLTNNVWGNNCQRPVRIIDGDNNVMVSNYVHVSDQGGFEMGGSATYNYIMANCFFSNDTHNIYMNGDDIDNNSIISNQMYGTGTGVLRTGIDISGGDNNIIK